MVGEGWSLSGLRDCSNRDGGLSRVLDVFTLLFLDLGGSGSGDTGNGTASLLEPGINGSRTGICERGVRS